MDSHLSIIKTEVDNLPISDKIPKFVEEFKNKMTELEKFHTGFRMNKKLLKEWGQLVKKTKQGAQKLINSDINSSMITYGKHESLNGMTQLLNNSKEMINHFYLILDGLENELMTSHLSLKKQGKELTKIEKQVKEQFKAEKLSYEQLTKRFKEQKQKATQNSVMGLQDESNISNQSALLIQTNNNQLQTTCIHYYLTLQMHYYQIEGQMISANQSCISTLNSIKKNLEQFKFEELIKQIPEQITSQNENSLNRISEIINTSQFLINQQGQLLSQQDNLPSTITSQKIVYMFTSKFQTSLPNFNGEQRTIKGNSMQQRDNNYGNLKFITKLDNIFSEPLDKNIKEMRNQPTLQQGYQQKNHETQGQSNIFSNNKQTQNLASKGSQMKKEGRVNDKRIPNQSAVSPPQNYNFDFLQNMNQQQSAGNQNKMSQQKENVSQSAESKSVRNSRQSSNFKQDLN